MSNFSIAGTTLSTKFVLTNRTDLDQTSGNISLKQAIGTLLQIDAANEDTGEGGQRIFNRAVGVNILRYLFMRDTPITREGIKREILKIQNFEPRIFIAESGVRVMKDPLRPEVWKIYIKYTVVASGETRNQVVSIFARERFAEVLPE